METEPAVFYPFVLLSVLSGVFDELYVIWFHECVKE